MSGNRERESNCRYRCDVGRAEQFQHRSTPRVFWEKRRVRSARILGYREPWLKARSVDGASELATTDRGGSETSQRSAFTPRRAKLVSFRFLTLDETSFSKLTFHFTISSISYCIASHHTFSHVQASHLISSNLPQPHLVSRHLSRPNSFTAESLEISIPSSTSLSNLTLYP